MKNAVVVGAGHAAGQLTATLLQKSFSGNITILGEEPWYPYQRPPLSKKFLSGEMPAERLYFKPENFYNASDVTVRLNTRASVVNRDNQTVVTDDGGSFPYDYLVLATGSRPRELDLPGMDLAGVHYLRSIDDVVQIRERLSPQMRMTIIGAGYIGLEVAAVATQRGLNVTVIEMADRVMSRVVSPEVSAFYQDVHTAQGVSLRLSTGLKGFAGDQAVDTVILDDNETVDTDIVVVGIGIVPNIELATECGLETGNGIIVDDHCRTSDPDIFSIGDCTWHPNALLNTELRLESVHNALEQAKTAAANICGEDLHYAQVPWFWSDQYNLKLQIAGISQGYDQVVLRGKTDQQSFSCLYLRKGQLISIDAVNSPRDFMQSKALIAAQAVIDPKTLENADIQLKDMNYEG